MKNIYILLTRSATVLSYAIHLITKSEYTHASIAFDADLETMCSFARKYRNLPLPGGLMKEHLRKGYFGAHFRTPCMLIRMQVSDEVYEKAKAMSEEMLARKDEYKFNIKGLILCKLGIAKKRDNYYFCSEFVSEILKKSKALSFSKCTSLIKPQDYVSMKEFQTCYVGTVGELAEYLYGYESAKYGILPTVAGWAKFLYALLKKLVFFTN